METKQAILPLSAPVSTSILLCLGNRHNHITVYDETIFVSSMTLYQQAMSLYIQSPLPCKSLLDTAQTRCSASCRCRLCVFQNALSALRRSAQPSRLRDVRRDWDCIPTNRARTAKFQCRACFGLCAHKGTACETE